jgi:hypothetical protein
MRGVNVEMLGFSGGPRRSNIGFTIGSSGEISVFLFGVLPLGGAIRPCGDGEEALGGGGKGGGNFP